MEDLIIKPKETELVTVLNTAGNGVDLPMPFERDIFLLGTEIVGTNHIDNIAELYASLNEGDVVTLIREPANPYDEYAIRVITDGEKPIGYILSEGLPEENKQVGYIPRMNNKVLARLMDAGKNLYGVVRHKEIDGYYHRIAIKVYMKD